MTNDEPRDYEVTMRGDVREVYVISATSREDAAARWHEGDLVISEASSMELSHVYEAE